jgi:hypothetical protein
LKNSEFVAFMALQGNQAAGGEWVVENCTSTAGAIAVFVADAGQARGVVRLSHVSVASSGTDSAIGIMPGTLQPAENQAEFHVSESVLSPGEILSVRRTAPALQENGQPFTPEALIGQLPKLMTFEGTRNLYSRPSSSAPVDYVWSWGDDGTWHHELKGLDAWKRLWGSPETGSSEGQVKFANGDLAAKIARDLDKVTPEDYRLRPDSPGYRAGADGKDLGADVDLVGPGVAYEKFKKTPEYQQWFADTRQQQRPAARPEPGAFVLMGDKGVEVGKYDTLAVAVERASHGDTVEIRGDGPFVTDPIRPGAKALTIRAGAGCAPVIESSQMPVKDDPYLLRTEGRLVVEGLELRIPRHSEYRALVGSRGAPLYVCNCKLVVNEGRLPETRYAVDAVGSPRGQVRNCLIVVPSEGVVLYCQPGMQWTIENCLSATLATALWVGPQSDNPFSGTKLRLSRNTFLTRDVVFSLSGPGEALADQFRAGKSIDPALVSVESNVFQAGYAFYLNSQTPKHPLGLPIQEQRQAISKLIRWQERTNVYGRGIESFIGLHGSSERPNVSNVLLKDLAEWIAFWGLKETGTLHDTVRLRGDPRELVEETPDDILPDDFRLRPESAGYQAGPDGKDLGADVDLVGPGAAYERWKKTPDYEQWLNETGQ